MIKAEPDQRKLGRGLGFWGGLFLTLTPVFLFYFPLISATRLSTHSDIANLFLPCHIYASEALQDGIWPFWNPYHYMGSPFHAGMQSALFYPLHWPFRVFLGTAESAVLALNLTRILHLLILAGGVYWMLQRGFELPALASAVGAITLTCSSYVWNHIAHINQIISLSWCPWIIGACRIYWFQQKLWALILLAPVFALGVLAGHPQNVAITLMFLALIYPAWLLSCSTIREAFSKTAILSATGLLGVILAAAQIVPTYEATKHAWIIGEGEEYTASIALPGIKLMEYIYPEFFGNDIMGRPEFTRGWMHGEYGLFFGRVGILLFLVGAVGVLARKTIVLRCRGGILLFAWLVGITLAVGQATPIFDIVLTLVPPLERFRAPARYMLISHWALVILLAHGVAFLTAALTNLRSRVSERPQSNLPYLGSLAGLLFLIVAQIGDLFYAAHWADFLNRPEYTLLPSHPAHVIPLEESGAASLEGHPVGPPKRMFWMILEDHFHLSGDRAHQIRASQFNPNNNLAYRLEMTHGYGESLQPTLRYRDFLYTWHRSFFQNRPDPELLRIMNVGWLVTDVPDPLHPDSVVNFYGSVDRDGARNVALYQTGAPYPRIFSEAALPYEGLLNLLDGSWKLIGQPIGGMNREELPWRERLERRDCDQWNEAALESQQFITIESPRYNRLRFYLDQPFEQLLVSQGAYPGWLVINEASKVVGTVDQSSAILQKLPSNLDEGGYQLVFQPGSIRIGMLITVFGIHLWVLALVLYLWQKSDE
jgi:hypothetical protein